MDDLEKNGAFRYLNGTIEGDVDPEAYPSGNDYSTNTEELVYEDVDIKVTESQYQAIVSPIVKNHLLKLNAGPGAGKTTTIVNRVCYLLSNGVKPEAILILSLTNRAVNNLKNQLERNLGYQKTSLIKLHTFNGFCNRLLRDFGPYYGFESGYKVLEDIKWKNLKSLFPSFSKLKTRKFLEVISDIKSKVGSYDVAAKYKANVDEVKKLADIITEYNLFSHLDVVVKGMELMKQAPEIFDLTECVIVDEFQDMYDMLIDITRIVSKNRHLTVAGDNNQSIYGFLGSSSDVMDNLDQIFPNHTITEINLNECFRSTPEIIGAAEAIVSNEEKRVVIGESGPKPFFSVFDDSQNEYEFVANEISRITTFSHGLIQPNHITILGYSNFQISQCKAVLTDYGFKSERLLSAPSWVETDVLYFVDYLNIISSSSNDFSLFSVLSLIKGVGPAKLQSLYTKSKTNNETLWNIILSEDPNNKVNHLMQEFMLQIERYRYKIKEDPENIQTILEVLCQLGYKYGLKDKFISGTKSDIQKRELRNDLNLFYNSLLFAKDNKPVDVPLIDYFLDKYINEEVKNESDTINLSTIHSAKGLEFPIVFVLGKTGWRNNEAYSLLGDDESKRLLYVALTRAKSVAYLTTRNSFGFEHDILPEKLRSKFSSNLPELDQKYQRFLTSSFKRPPLEMIQYDRKRINDEVGKRMFHTLTNGTRLGKSPISPTCWKKCSLMNVSIKSKKLCFR